jgi:transcriptional regulator with XRE-family HTH domain
VHNLREVREEAGVHQAALARALGKEQSYVSRLENAERRLGILDLLAIAQALDIAPTDLFARITRDVPSGFRL